MHPRHPQPKRRRASLAAALQNALVNSRVHLASRPSYFRDTFRVGGYPREVNWLPIVNRELRVAARKRSTFWLRIAAALTALVIGSGCMILSVLQGMSERREEIVRLKGLKGRPQIKPPSGMET